MIKMFKEWLNEGFLQSDPFYKMIPEIEESEMINAFKEYGLHVDNIDYDNYEIIVTFSSYAYGGELPKNITDAMSKISETIGADNWTFWDPMSKVRFFFKEDEED